MFIFNVPVANTFLKKILSFLSFICCDRQQAVEDLLEDEEEDFDKDDKVIMSRVRDAVTYKQIHKHTHAHRPGDGFDTASHTGKANRWMNFPLPPPPIVSSVHLFLLPEAQTCLPRLYNLLTFLKSFLCRCFHISHFSRGLLLVFSCSWMYFPPSPFPRTPAHFLSHSCWIVTPLTCSSAASWEHAAT